MNPLVIIWRLLKLVRPLAHVMLFTILSGAAGAFAATFIMVFGVISLLNILGLANWLEFSSLVIILICLSVARGVLRYCEQRSGHYIAFKLLAIIRQHIFDALRRLAFTKLTNRDSGQLITIITADVEMLEVFYAHSIAPIAIALICCTSYVVLFAFISPWLALLALVAYLAVGLVLPVWVARGKSKYGHSYRQQLGLINQQFLDLIKGLKEIILFSARQTKFAQLQQGNQKINQAALALRQAEGKQRAWSEVLINLFNLLFFALALYLFYQQQLDFAHLLLCLVLLMASYGPVLALSNLSTSLIQVLASGARVLALLDEPAQIDEVTSGIELTQVNQLQINQLNFSYQQQPVLNDINILVAKGQILGVHGRSGCGKSTLLKLIMRFHLPNSGSLLLDGHNLENINSSSLRSNIALVSQSTYLFNETIYENILLANRKATNQQIIQAAKKASVHDFIMSLPQQYDTKLQELGQNISDGEKQRIGVARAFLHDAPIILLDEPTSNLDSLNEAIILQSLLTVKQDKIIIIVSHRASTMAICDQIYEI